MTDDAFGPANEWPQDDLIGWSDELTPEFAIAGYRSGVFPMPLEIAGVASATGWWSPLRRAILPLDGLRVTRSLRQSWRRYTTTIDTAFDRVIDRCADPRRDHGWIDGQIRRVYTELARRGLAHSFETWDAEGRLVGGLYGVSLGGLFAGESMFHDPNHGRDASKVALMRLVEHLRAQASVLLDVQWRTAHLASLGVIEITRERYLELLAASLDVPDAVWPCPAR